MKTIEQIHELFLQYPTICKDTRKVMPNSIFVALKGENFDGNNFAKDALAKGCKYAIVDKAEVATDDRYILVDNVLTTLQDLAKHHRLHCNAKIIGITGTNGKTTTKELIKEVLATTYEVIATEGNYNNHIGVPLSLLRIKPSTEIAIIEMGANHLHEIAELCEIALPDYGIITNVGKAHIEGFGSFEGIIKTKTELYEAVEQRGGTVFVNTDNEILSEKANAINSLIYSYGTANAQVQGLLTGANPFCELVIEDSPIKTELIGDYNFENMLAAYTIGKFFKVPKADSLNAIANYVPKDNRSELVETDNNTLILDAYNANATSMEKSVNSFAKNDYINKHLILGDMLELGHLSKQLHDEIKTLVEQLGLASKTWLVGKHFSEEKTGDFTYFETTQKLLDYLTNNPLRDKQILVKGSRGIRLESLVKKL